MEQKSPEINCHVYSHLNFNKGTNAVQRHFQQMILEQLEICMGRTLNILHKIIFTPFTKTRDGS